MLSSAAPKGGLSTLGEVTGHQRAMPMSPRGPAPPQPGQSGFDPADMDSSAGYVCARLSFSPLHPMHPIVIIPLLIVWLTTWSAIHLYIWRRLVRDTGLTGRWRRAATAFIVVMAATMPVTELLNRVFHLEVARTMA